MKTQTRSQFQLYLTLWAAVTALTAIIWLTAGGLQAATSAGQQLARELLQSG